MKFSSAATIPLVGGVLIIIAGLAVLAGQVGGIAIRSTGINPVDRQLWLSEPAVRGTLTAVRWEPGKESDITPLSFFIRDASGEHLIGQANSMTGEARVLMPCQGESATVSLIAKNTQTSQVLASRSVKLLPPGPECVLH